MFHRNVEDATTVCTALTAQSSRAAPASASRLAITSLCSRSDPPCLPLRLLHLSLFHAVLNSSLTYRQHSTQIKASVKEPWAHPPRGFRPTKKPRGAARTRGDIKPPCSV